ncbi:hypothetical protein MVEN_02171000 [Mycena venus]|uniref:Uncharacterized protein n=1 Tax=Mycena venus TaxID=2733690 RepID=A0A8H6X8V6_9AGAR|nr:hypothetical protein MVEN_02171000 [Mycena venus]
MRLDEKATFSPPPYNSPRYVYYCVYAPDGPIYSKRASDPSQPFIGRIKATSVPPPLIVASLKRTLAHAERIPDPLGLRTDLYRLSSDQIPMDDAEAVPILGGGNTIASTAADALTLVFVDELDDEEKQDIPRVEATQQSESPADQYVYYRLHTRSGEDFSICALDPDEPAIGRIDRSTIAPPRNVLSIKRGIARVEGRPIYAFADLYADVTEGPLANDAFVSLVGSDGVAFPGSNPADALRLVQPERYPGLFNRPLKILVEQPRFWNRSPRPGTLPWLQVFCGDIVYTDGFTRTENCPIPLAPGNWTFQHGAAYTVVDASGVKGLIKAENVKFLDE